MKAIGRVPLFGRLVGRLGRRKRRPTAEELMAMDRNERLAFFRAIGLEDSIKQGLRELDNDPAH